MTITLPYAPLPGNKYVRSCWQKQREEVRRWEQLVLQEAKRFGPWARAKYPPRKARLRILVHRKGKLQDRTNFFISLKSLEDALKRLGWIYDDSRQWLESDYEEVLAGQEGPRTEIEVSWEK